MTGRVELVNNIGPNTVESVFRELARSARTLHAVVAFATKSGVDAVLPYVRQIAERGHASITVGLYQGVTEPSALRSLAKAEWAMGGRLTIFVARMANLHRKVYIFGLAKKVALLIGSSNMSAEGLRSEGECNVLLYLPGRPADFRSFVPELTADTHVKMPLTAQLISEYELSRNRPRPGIGRGALHRLLRTKRSNPPDPNPNKITAWLRHCLTGYVKKRTLEALAQQTDWDRRGWDWCSIASGDRVSIGDHVLLFDYMNRVAWARVVVVKGITGLAPSFDTNS